MPFSVNFTSEKSVHNKPPGDTYSGSTDESGFSDSENTKPKRGTLSRAATLAEEDESFQAIVDTLQSWANKKRPTQKPYEWDLTPNASDGESEKTSDSDSDNSVMRKSVRFNDDSHKVVAPFSKELVKSPKKGSLNDTLPCFFDPKANSKSSSETVAKTRQAKLNYLRQIDSNVSEKLEKGPPKLIPTVAEKKGAFLNKLAAFQSKDDKPLKPTGIVTAMFTHNQQLSVPNKVGPKPPEKPSKETRIPTPESKTSKSTPKQTVPKVLAESYYDNVQGVEEREKEVTENLEHSYRPSKSQSSTFANARNLFNQAANTKEVSPKSANLNRPKKVIKVDTRAFEKP